MEYLLFFFSFFMLMNFSAYLADQFQVTSPKEKALLAYTSLYLSSAIVVLICGFLSIINPYAIILFCFLINVPCFILAKNRKYLSNLCFSIEKDRGEFIGLFILIFYFLVANFGTVWISLDDSTYHAAIPALWLKYGTFFVKSFTYQASFPLNGSLFSTFFMIFFGNEFFSSFSEVLLVLIGFLSVSVLSLGKKNSTLLFLGFFLFFSSVDVQKYLSGFSDSDILPSVLFLASFVFISNKNNSTKLNYYGFLILGFLVGVKLTNLFFCLPFFVLFLTKKPTLKSIISSALFFIVLSHPWYLKNIFEFGNPIYPFEKFGLNGIFDTSLTRISSAIGVWGSLDTKSKVDFLLGFLGWQKQSWVLSVVLILMFLKALLKPNHRTILVGFFASFVIFTYFYVGAPFSGLNESLGLKVSSNRYYLPIFLPFIIFLIMDIDLAENKLINSLLCVLVFVYFLIPRLSDKRALLASFIFIGVGLLWKYNIINKIRVNLLTSAMTLILFITFFSGEKVNDSKKNTIWFLKYLENEKSNSRISIADDFIFRSFYLFGAGFRFNPVRLNYFGSESLSDDEVLKNYIYADLKPKINDDFCHTYSKNLLESEVDIFILSKSPKGIWPQQKCVEIDSIYLNKIVNDNGIIYKNLKKSNI